MPDPHTRQVPQQTQSSLSATDLLNMTTSEVDKRFRALNADRSHSDLNVAWLANHTVDPLMRAATVIADAYGVTLNCVAAPYDQYFQELLDDQSATLSHSPQAIVLSLSLRQLAPGLVYGSGSLATEAVNEKIAATIDRIGEWIGLALKNSQAHLLIGNFVRPPSLRYGIADTALSAGELYIYTNLNLRLAELVASEPRASIIDFNHAAACAGLSSNWTPRMYHLAKIEWDTRSTLSMAMHIARSCRAIVKPARKCLVVDLDNTVWGGVLGEEGPTGIRVGAGDPVGESFAAFQSALLDLKARGVVLAICSKNNLSDVEEAFSLRTEMPLTLDDFAYHAVNWNPKHENIKSIADALNIGTDSIAFVDDNPVECELVRQTLPEVLTIELPRDAATYADLIYELPDFDKLRLTEEDAQKSRQYADNFKRSAHQESVGDMSAFLESLETKVVIEPARKNDINRVHQLFTKTNQFNLTTIRYDIPAISAAIESPDCHLHTIRASDKFGDLGMIGLYLLREQDDAVLIDSFVMSCRALGRGIETAACNTLKSFVFDTLGAGKLLASYVPTAKNKPAVDFYERQRFEQSSSTDKKGTDYSLLGSTSENVPCPGIEIDFTSTRDE